MRRFNVTGLCVPEEDYMVDISGKIGQIVKLVNERRYFTINRARQYGKTTTLSQLKLALNEDYVVISISFEGLGDESFATAETFCQALIKQVVKALRLSSAPQAYADSWADCNAADFIALSAHITNMCRDQKVVLMIDEVDKSTNNRVMIHFLGMLREKFLARRASKDHTFHSVILAGVYDIRNIKLKMINDGLYTPSQTDGQIYNSPWNIAVNFDVDMSFSPPEIATMLSDYEADHHTGMDIGLISEEIHTHTSGYPFLVSRICQCIDEELDKDWTKTGLQEAIKRILHEENVLFDDISKNLENNKELYDFLYSLLIVGERKSFTLTNPVVKMASMYGYIKRGNGVTGKSATGPATIANKMFEMLLSYYFSSKDENVSRMEGSFTRGLYQEVVKGNTFDMELCMRRFTEHYRELYAEADATFLERHGRLLFLSWLKPLVNGKGFYHIESQFTDTRRMDVVVDFGSDQFIIELKIWRGEAAQDKAYDQLLDYMDAKNTDKGYLLTFDFRKVQNKADKADWVQVGGKEIFEVIV